ncbi:DUF5686 and carboxypeptidase regulatory-like domain-containing protein [Sediminibacterium soli]|uniref:DUF5686 and carboxypeptidase regulatory-like domain-containing protein n=1 Tax=Sediminibacterium soli TaxID=2698829 RepID=UPI00137A87E4|nr:DUF5686 and carboxypeptidase regulatory-like domain-containing protein [Sediminibacterium soli]NCI47102.1 carboxypeptidase-like regulatory domain-containing protein [Sediminibacterium soli]
MYKPLLLLLTVLISLQAYAATISGTITQKNGTVLPFSSVLVKGTTEGVSANGKGQYHLNLLPGEYLLVCQYIGYRSQEKKIRVGRADQVVDFELEPQQYNLNEVVVTSGGEDPSYAIIRKAIATREEHRREIKSFQCEVYLKGQLQMRDYPNRVMGKKVDFNDGDTSKRKMVFLSEVVARYSVSDKGQEKIEVTSSKVSGRSNSFGFSDPQIVSLYDNHIAVGEELNPRGFLSPIAAGALNFYRYKLEGSFYENDKLINRIRVIPRREYEPVFSGYINIVEDEWRIQSVDLYLLKKQQMQLLDTVRLQQLYVPYKNLWVIKNQVIYPSGKILGFDFFGNFVQVYDKFDMNPTFPQKFFDHVTYKFNDSATKKTMAYWDSIRPVPLLTEEVRDYRKKDSLEQLRQDPRYLDSLDRKRNKFQPLGMLLGGQTFSYSQKKISWGYSSPLSGLGYNTVEGAVITVTGHYRKRYEGRRVLSMNPELRYGITNRHFNPSLSVTHQYGKKYLQSLSFGGGRKVFQFNNAEPLPEAWNTPYTLLRQQNYLKIYEAEHLHIGYSAGIGNGVNASFGFQYQNRHPLDNLPDIASWNKYPTRQITPNYPTEILAAQMQPNVSSVFTAGITWRPGSDYIEMPDRKINIGSRYPVITASISQGIRGLFGSDADFTRWRISISDDIDMKLAGKFNYSLGFGGFLSASKVFLPDYQHYLGNQLAAARNNLTTFQLAPYYRYSNTARFNMAAHGEYHLNGLLSNKIPGFRKLNCFFVVGAHALHIDKGLQYAETSFGIENIFKILRVDFVQGFESTGGRPSGFRVGIRLN